MGVQYKELTFVLPAELIRKIEIWKKSHKCNRRGLLKGELVAGGTNLFTYCFHPTSLGDIVEVKCECGAEFKSFDLLN